MKIELVEKEEVDPELAFMQEVLDGHKNKN